MIEAELDFRIALPYNRTTFDALNKLCVKNYWDQGRKEAVWFFRTDSLEQVEQIVGNPIHIQGWAEYKQKMNVERVKGKGEYRVLEFPDYFEVTEWQKDDKGVSKPHQLQVPKSEVKLFWNIMLKYPKEKEIKGITIQEHMCNALGIDRYNRLDTATFDKAKFFGDRSAYRKYYLYPVKICKKLGLITHSKIGKVARIAESYDFTQKTLRGTTEVFVKHDGLLM